MRPLESSWQQLAGSLRKEEQRSAALLEALESYMSLDEIYDTSNSRDAYKAAAARWNRALKQLQRLDIMPVTCRATTIKT